MKKDKKKKENCWAEALFRLAVLPFVSAVITHDDIVVHFTFHSARSSMRILQNERKKRVEDVEEEKKTAVRKGTCKVNLTQLWAMAYKKTGNSIEKIER